MDPTCKPTTMKNETLHYEVNKHSTETLSQSLNIIDDVVAQVQLLVVGIRENIKSEILQTNGSISLLDVKNMMMMNYLMNLVYIIAKKCHGGSIEGDSAVDRLVEIRTVLERIRPLEHKLKYMIDKLIKTGLTGVEDKNDPTQFRANPENMLDDNISDSGSESEKEHTTPAGKSEKKSGIYVPPRLAPVHYDEEESVGMRQQRQLERAKRHALHSSVVQELREEYLDTPVEISYGSSHKRSINKHQQQRIQYEEDNFTRLSVSKKDKRSKHHSRAVKNIGDELTHFEDIQVLEDEETFSRQKKLKRKSSGKPNKKRGFKKRKTR